MSEVSDYCLPMNNFVYNIFYTNDKYPLACPQAELRS